MASIEVRKRVHRDGGKYRVYRVIWRDPAGRKKSKTFGRKKPAERFAVQRAFLFGRRPEDCV